MAAGSELEQPVMQAIVYTNPVAEAPVYGQEYLPEDTLKLLWSI